MGNKTVKKIAFKIIFIRPSAFLNSLTFLPCLKSTSTFLSVKIYDPFS